MKRKDALLLEGFRYATEYAKARGINRNTMRTGLVARKVPGAIQDKSGRWLVPIDCDWMPCPQPGQQQIHPDRKLYQKEWMQRKRAQAGK